MLQKCLTTTSFSMIIPHDKSCLLVTGLTGSPPAFSIAISCMDLHKFSISSSEVLSPKQIVWSNDRLLPSNNSSLIIISSAGRVVPATRTYTPCSRPCDLMKYGLCFSTAISTTITVLSSIV